MGNTASSSPALNAALTRIADANKTPSPRATKHVTASTCAVKRVEYNQLVRDAKKKKEEVEVCDPAATHKQKVDNALKKSQEYIKEHDAQMTQAYDDCKTRIETLSSLTRATKPLREYSTVLKTDLAKLQETNQKLEHSERMQRRNFQDGGPQDGVSSLPGLRTYDDKVLMAFWICYGAAVILTTVFVLRMYADQIGDTTKQIQIGVGILLAAYGLAYYAIVLYG